MILLLGSLGSCDRFKDKWERRERKIHYLNEEIDSARNIQARYQDSLRHAHDSIRKQQK
ncbi:MAG: hypothetical protein IPM69_13305 [Ignavibacteria bacterium]|nr:hypothetical protein [Ignavibacteria bacterium]